MSLFSGLDKWFEQRARQRERACLQALVDIDSEDGVTAIQIIRQAQTYSKLVAIDSIYSVLGDLVAANLIATPQQTDATKKRGRKRQPQRYRITQAGRNQIPWLQG